MNINRRIIMVGIVAGIMITLSAQAYQAPSLSAGCYDSHGLKNDGGIRARPMAPAHIGQGSLVT